VAAVLASYGLRVAFSIRAFVLVDKSTNFVGSQAYTGGRVYSASRSIPLKAAVELCEVAYV
jgi:hypothetical protein